MLCLLSTVPSINPAGKEPSTPVAIGPEVTGEISEFYLEAPLKEPWFSKIASGEKTVEFRKQSPWWVSRLFPKKRPSPAQLLLVNGKVAKSSPTLLVNIASIQKDFAVSDIPKHFPNMAPPVGSEAFKSLFGDDKTCIAIFLGDVVKSTLKPSSEGTHMKELKL